MKTQDLGSYLTGLQHKAVDLPLLWEASLSFKQGYWCLDNLHNKADETIFL